MLLSLMCALVAALYFALKVPFFAFGAQLALYPCSNFFVLALWYALEHIIANGQKQIENMKRQASQHET